MVFFVYSGRSIYHNNKENLRFKILFLPDFQAELRRRQSIDSLCLLVNFLFYKSLLEIKT